MNRLFVIFSVSDLAKVRIMDLRLPVTITIQYDLQLF